MDKLNNKQKDLLLNLLLQEQRNIHNLNGNMQPLLEDYRLELGKIYKIICDSLESDEDLFDKICFWVEHNLTYNQPLEPQIDKIIKKFPELENKREILIKNIYYFFNRGSDTPYTCGIIKTMEQ